MYNVIDPEQMRSRLLSVDAAKSLMAPTEGLSEYAFTTDGSDKVHFSFPDGWNENLDMRGDFETTTASVDINGHELSLTKHGALEAASKVGFQQSSAMDTPGEFIEPYVNYWYMNGARGQKNLKLLSGDNGGIAVTRGTIQPFSNTELLDAVSAGINERYGDNIDDLLVDYKLGHDIGLTNLRVIVPSHQRHVSSARAATAGDDPWSVGIQITNSISGSSSLSLSGYLFAWWCTNGQTIQRATSGKYRRKPSLEPSDAYNWARESVDDIFTDLEPELDIIEALTHIPLEGELNATLNGVFDRFEVPNSLLDRVMENLVESDDITAYGLLNSITSAANDDGLSAGNVNALLRAGGDFAYAIHAERCPTCHKF